MTLLERKPGDIFLLFGEFAYDFETDLPIRVGPCVYLDHTPHGILGGAQPPALADFVLPGYNLNAGSPNSCLRYSSDVGRPGNIQPSSLLFNSIVALRFVAPRPMRVEGRFTVGQDGSPIDDPSLYHLTSPWQPELGGYYSARDVRLAAGIARRLMRLLDPAYGRIATAIVLFSQVTTGQVKSFQMAYLGLFAALEALFAPKGKKAEILAERSGRFLAGIGAPSGWSVRDWLT